MRKVVWFLLLWTVAGLLTARGSSDQPLAVDNAAPEVRALGISVPLLSDTDHSVSEVYDVLQWAVGTGEPGHTFILVGTDGKIAWIQDYGA